MVPTIPPRVREAVEQDARARNVSLAYAVGTVVAEALGVIWTGPKGYPFRVPTSPNAKWVIQFPLHVKAALEERARQEGAAMWRLIVAMLAEHHGLPIPSPKDRRSLAQPRGADGRFGQRSG